MAMSNARMGNRSRDELLYQMLLAAYEEKDVSRTRMVYKAMMSYHQAGMYLDLMVKNNLVHYNQKARTYSITSRGMNFIRAYVKLSEFIPAKSNYLSPAPKSGQQAIT